MFKLRFLFMHYARPSYPWLIRSALAGIAVAGAAFFTPWFMPIAIVLAAVAAIVAAAAATLAILVLNVVVAASMHRAIGHFEAAYDAWRKANNVFDIFYEEMDLEDAAAEAAAREGAGGA